MLYFISFSLIWAALTLATNSLQTPFVVSPVLLAEPMALFGAVVYDNKLFTLDGFNVDGDSITDERSADFLSSSSSWTTNTVSYPTFAAVDNASASVVPMHIWLWYNQQLMHLSSSSPDIVFIVHPDLGITGASFELNHKTLLKYDLSAHSYIDPNTYSSISISYQRDACFAFSDTLSKLYIVGGVDRSYQYLNTAQIYDTASDTWTQITLPDTGLYQRRRSAGCAMDGNSEYMYVFGGEGFGSAQSYTDTIFQYAMAGDVWTMVAVSTDAPTQPTLKTASNYFKCALMTAAADEGVNEGRIYCVGAWTGNTAYTDVNVFDPSTLTIDSETYVLNIARWRFAVVVHQHCLYVMGGQSTVTGLLDSIEYLCVNTTDAGGASSSNLTLTSGPTFVPTSVPTFVPSLSSSPSTMPTRIPSSSLLLSDSPTVATGYPTLYPSAMPTDDDGENPQDPHSSGAMSVVSGIYDMAIILILPWTFILFLLIF